MEFLHILDARAVLGDGAMGTELLKKGFTAERPLATLNLIRPRAVLAIHRRYVAAGAELLRANTFLAQQPYLDAARVREVNLAGVRLAREAGAKFVAGSVAPAEAGPGRLARYREQCDALAEAGCDAIVLETFRSLEDLRIAVRAAAATGLPVIANRSLGAPRPVRADVVGLNCIDPEAAIRVIGRGTGRRLAAFPSAGLPDARGCYPVTPQVFAEAVVRLIALGVRLVGGCCGTTPAHIRAAADRCIARLHGVS